MCFIVIIRLPPRPKRTDTRYPYTPLFRSIEGLVSDSALHFSIGPLISWSFPNRDAARARIDQASSTTKATLAEFDGTVFTGASGGRERTHAICRSEEHTSELQ